VIVKLYGADDLHWPSFNDKEQTVPRYLVGRHNWINVYPEPCYRHSMDLVQQCLEICEQKMKIEDGQIAILSHEFIGRNNGVTCQDHDYTARDKVEKIKCHCCDKMEDVYPLSHTIALCGKPIPILPSMTKYLVAHEYGHAVWNHKCKILGYNGGDTKLCEKYMALRGQDGYDSSGPHPTWHREVHEIGANDFRILIAGAEVDFWPHDVPRAESKLAEFWLADTREEMEKILG
jgi:hypothetical protein